MGHGRSNWMLIAAVAHQMSGAEPMARPSRSYARAIAVQTPWQSRRVAMMPPFKKWRGPAACSRVRLPGGDRLVALPPTLEVEAVGIVGAASPAEVVVHLVLERAAVRRAHVLGTFHGDGAMRYSGGAASRIEAAPR